MKTTQYMLPLLMTTGLLACGTESEAAPDATPESADDLGLDVDAQDIERAAEAAAAEVTEENADELLDALEAEIGDDG